MITKERKQEQEKKIRKTLWWRAQDEATAKDTERKVTERLAKTKEKLGMINSEKREQTLNETTKYLREATALQYELKQEELDLRKKQGERDSAY